MGVILTVNLLKAKLLKLTHGIFIVERIGLILAIFFTGNTAIFFVLISFTLLVIKQAGL